MLTSTWAPVINGAISLRKRGHRGASVPVHSEGPWNLWVSGRLRQRFQAFRTQAGPGLCTALAGPCLLSSLRNGRGHTQLSKAPLSAQTSPMPAPSPVRPSNLDVEKRETSNSMMKRHRKEHIGLRVLETQ